MRTQIVTLVVADAPPWQVVKARTLISARGNIVELLIEAGFAPAKVLLAASTATGLPTAPATWLRDPKPPAIGGLDAALCRQLGAAPIASVAGQLCIGFSDPELATASDALGLPRHTPYLALPADLARALAALPEPEGDPATWGQNTAPALAQRPAAWEPPSQSDVPTRALPAHELHALSQQSAPIDPFDEPTELVPGLASTAAPPLRAPPVTVSEVPTVDVPSHFVSAMEVPLEHQRTAAEGVQAVADSTASGLVWDPASQEAPLSEFAAPTAPAVYAQRTFPPAPLPLARAPTPLPIPRAPTPLPIPRAGTPVPFPRAPTPMQIPRVPTPLPVQRPAPPAIATSGELADALSDAMRAIGAVPPPRGPPPRPPSVVTNTFGLPTAPIDTRKEAREYLAENPPTILQKGPQGTQVEPVRLLLLGAPQDFMPERARESGPIRRALPVLVVAVLVLAAVGWFVVSR